jgi:hypothetical protein
VQDQEAVEFCRIPINDLDWRPGPLPNADAWRAGELDLPAGALDGNFIYGRSGPLWISRSVPDHQFEWSSGDPAGVIDFASGQLESSEQVLARLDPARLG